MANNNHEQYMRRALELAWRGAGSTSPNPLVGCVVVKDGRIIAQGYHERYSGFHAERNALKSCCEDCTGGDLYVNLEPCCHYGKTPPCTDIIIERGIKRVFIGSVDPNPLVHGKGIEALKRAGIEVTTGVLRAECDRLNDVFFHHIAHHSPFVVLKYAMTLDGKIATRTGQSRWVSSDASRYHANALRKRYGAVVAGSGTVSTDNPLLTCRIDKDCNPLRVICDSHLSISLDSQIVQTADAVPTIIAYVSAHEEQIASLAARGVECVHLPDKKGKRVDLGTLLSVLANRGIDSVLVEGGATVHAEFLKEHLAHKVCAYIAPKIVGGVKAPGPIAGEGAATMNEALELIDTNVERIGCDVLVTGYLPWSQSGR